MTDDKLSVLVVDDNKTAAMAVAALLRREGHEVEVRYDGAAAIELLGERRLDLVLTDLRMEPVDGLAVVQAARAADPPVEVMVFTAFGSVEVAVEAMRLGALDFLTKPVTAEQILHRVRQLQPVNSAGLVLVGSSDASATIARQARAMARVRSTVLLTGEPGIGRRHLARWLHAHGLDKDRELVIARPGQTFDPGTLARAGTLLIPNIDDWSADAQVRLQRELETLEAGQPPRVIATARPAIDVLVAKGEFPAELYFRLAVLVLPLPPLRERPTDVPVLLDHFLAQHSRAFDTPAPSPSAGQLARLQSHGWPGNIRELANLAERAVVLGPDAFDMDVKPAAPADHPLPALAEGFNLAQHLEEIERTLLIRSIEQTGGDRPAMSRLLGLERNTLRYKLNKYGLLDRT
ncbi:MAG: sigma-54-dependent Fis family transcriptional regulator [Deltaproteobacteria bacterium]|nr:MAG: sigma-54-dependent Fis family transcriptional regulator [Deltaproteobacteria bacterium]